MPSSADREPVRSVPGEAERQVTVLPRARKARHRRAAEERVGQRTRRESTIDADNNVDG